VGVCNEGGQRQDVSGRKALRNILAHIPRRCSSDVLYGTLGYFHPVYSLMLPSCAQMLEHGGWPMAPEALRFSFEVAVVSAGLRWHGTVNVKSITEQIQHTEYCQGDCTGKGSTSLA
jgi:hypothetical protein